MDLNNDVLSPKPASEGRRTQDPPPEVNGDYFDRQRVIDSFHQNLVESQRCLVLGMFNWNIT